MPWHKGLVAYTSLRRPGFYPRLVCVGFLVDKVTLWRAFFSVNPSVFPGTYTDSFNTVAMYAEQVQRR